LSKGPITVSKEGARRLTVTKQHLAGEIPSKPDRDDILSLIRDIGYIQWDPITIVAPSHHISLWSRLGRFRPDDLEKLLWEERKVFEHWTPIASIVLTEDYPLYLTLMRGYPESLSHSWANHIPRAKRFMATHGDLRRRVLKDLKGRSLTLSQFSGYERKGRSTDGWSSGNDVSNMLFHLLMAGEVMVVGHEGNQNVWGLTGEFLPRWANKERLTMKVFEREAAQRAIRALGTAAPSEINYYFVRGRYQTLKQTLAELEEDSLIHQVRVQGFERKEVRYIHDRDLPLLESLRGDGWMPRTTLIAAFDNLIAGRQRANTVFGFDYVHEQFLPKSKRRYGTYVLPILHGERLVGRIDPRYDKEKEVLVINSVHAEPGAPEGKEVSGAIRETIGDLAEFIGAREVEFAGKVPENWRKSLR
jgi:uncharacterized protein